MTSNGSADPMPMRAARGAVAGIGATTVMTLARLGAERAGVFDERPPQSEIVGRLRALRGRRTGGPATETLATIAHYAFGAVAGALYAMLPSRRVRPVGGVLYASAIWTMSYHQLLPRLRLMPRPQHDDTGRQIAIAVDHVLYGVSLDALLSGLERKGPLRKRA
jgi:hypothetical protein